MRQNIFIEESTYSESDHKRKWREWHEREVPVKITGSTSVTGMNIKIDSDELKSSLALEYPNSIWQKYLKQNKVKLLDNVTYIFTSHLPFLLKGNIRLEYNTGYPQTYSWANQCFMRFLPAYWYLQRGRRGTGVFPLLKTMLNSRTTFKETKDIPPSFPETLQKNVIIPFTFGKDSFLSYLVAKEIGLNPTLVYYNEPTELYAREHKLNLIRRFEKETGESIYFMDNPLGNLREIGEGWFGWELALTSWTLLSLPFAYVKKAAYIIFSNEWDVNKFFYDDEGLKVIPDYEQSAQALEELSIMTQSLSEGEVYTTTFLQGLRDLAIISIIKQRWGIKTYNFLMSCWAENESAKDKRWCATCSKCARLYVYMVACGIDPVKDAGFKDNMLELDKLHLYNVFGSNASGTGWDAFGLNTDEQALAFYLAYLRGNRDALTLKFKHTQLFKEVEANFPAIINTYFDLYPESSMPLQWRNKINKIYKDSLGVIRKEMLALN
jgi:hypothetical protein